MPLVRLSGGDYRPEWFDSEALVADGRALLNMAAAHWNILRLEGEIVDRARCPFPCEPLRTLDAIHLASALSARAIIPGLRLLSLDQRILASAKVQGFDPLPLQNGIKLLPSQL